MVSIKGSVNRHLNLLFFCSPYSQGNIAVQYSPKGHFLFEVRRKLLFSVDGGPEIVFIQKVRGN